MKKGPDKSLFFKNFGTVFGFKETISMPLAVFKKPILLNTYEPLLGLKKCYPDSG